jgi:hypothetical protein
MAALASNIIILFLIEEDLQAKFSSEYFSQCPQ